MPDVGRLVLWAGTTRSPLAPVLGAITTSPIWRIGCQGVGVDGHVLVGVAGGVVAAGGAVRAFAGFATFGHAHIRGLGNPKTFVRRTSA